MKIRKYSLSVFGLMLILMVIISCQKDENDSNPPSSELEVRTGKLNPIVESSIDFSDLEIISFAGSSDIDNEGNFEVKATKAEKFQQLLVVSKSTENVIYIGLYNPVTDQVTVNDTSTVLSLLLINPHLFYTTQDQREQYIKAVEDNPRFPQLLSLFRQSVQDDPESVFDFEANPTFYQTAVLIMKETIESLQSGKSKSSQAVMFGGEPTIEDGEGKNIVFVNPRHVIYGAGIYPDDQLLKETVTVNKQSSIISFNWSLDNLIGFNEPERTNYSLDDGQYRIYLTKKYELDKITQWNDPVGRATISNTGHTIWAIFDLVIGYCPSPVLAKLPNFFTISATRMYLFTEAILKKDLFSFVETFLSTVTDNAEAIAVWFWEDAIDDAGREISRKSAEKFVGIISNVNIAFKLLSFANGPGPMFYDLFFAPPELNYYITQTNGVITSNTENFAPEAKFTITPPAGIVGTNFSFNASESVDDKDNLSQLRFRWDFESDGTWDTEWSNSYTISHSYSTSSSYAVTLEVMDLDGLTGTINHSLSVGGGAGTASHVILFMDVYPWDSDAMIRMLQGLGFSEGAGTKTYEVLTSSDMESATLIPGQDLVIIANDQPQTFYDNYAANQVRFTNFVYNGGALFWEACDNGWHYGSIKNANIILPGDVKTNFYYDYYNYVTDPNLPLVSELPSQLDHNYASHEYFTDLPDGTTVYCVDSQSNPTLIEFNFGVGWIIYTGQPLEHQFDRIYGSPDMESLLPAIVSYFTGSQLKKSMIPSVKNLPEKPSHLFQVK